LLSILYNLPVQERKAVMTIETSYSQAREQLKSLMDRAVDDREVIVVRRRGGGDVAMIAVDELSSLMETAHLLRSSKNAERLLTALSRARAQESSKAKTKTKRLAPISLADLNKLAGTDA
jgi:antitoxin YefM